MSAFILFWVGKYIAQALFIGGVFIIAILLNLPSATKMVFCKHPRYRENRACDAICSDCGRNLGFIQPLRERDRLRAQQENGDG